MTGDDRAWDEVLARNEAWRQRELKTLALRQEVRELRAEIALLRQDLAVCREELSDTGVHKP